MNCKYCNEPLVEGKPFCPSCGKPVEEESTVNELPVQETVLGPEIEEPKKTGTGKSALAVAAVVVVAAVLIAVIFGGTNILKPLSSTGETVAPTSGMIEESASVPEETVPATIPADGNPDDVTCKGSYTGTDDEVTAAGATVVATMGEKELTVDQLQIYYWLEFYYFMQNYGSYASYFGLDYTQPLDMQTCGIATESMTWQQYFLESALNTWQTYQSMALEAEAAGVELDEETRNELTELSETMDSIAQENGFADANDWIHTDFGAGASPQSYIDHFNVYYRFWTYYDDQSGKAVPTAADVEAYFAENEATYTESGITKDSGKYVDVRHILIMPEGGTYDETTYTTTYSDEEWAAAREEAQGILDQWLAGDKTEDSFAALANEYSADSDGTDGGLYTNVYEGQMVENFEAWCFDESRKTGDYDLVQTEYGYHIMYFVDSRDIWYATAESDLLNSRVTEVLTNAREAHPVEIDYSAILLATIDLG